MIPTKARLFCVIPVAFGLIFLDEAPAARGASANVAAVADTTLQSAYPSENFGDGTSFQAGGRRKGGSARGLLRFDLSGSVPAGATINSVTLTLSVTATPVGGPNSLFDLRRVQASWGEGNKTDHGGSTATAGEATWTSRFTGSSLWGSPGGDFSGVVSASRSVGGNGSYTFASTANLVSDVQNWVNDPGNNFGWIVMSESENIGASIRRFGNRNSGAFAPLLTVNYTAVPEPGTWAVILLGGAALWRSGMKRKRG